MSVENDIRTVRLLRVFYVCEYFAFKYGFVFIISCGAHKKIPKADVVFIILQRCFSDVAWFAKGAHTVNGRVGSGTRISSSVS